MHCQQNSFHATKLPRQPRFQHVNDIYSKGNISNNHEMGAVVDHLSMQMCILHLLHVHSLK